MVSKEALTLQEMEEIINDDDSWLDLDDNRKTVDVIVVPPKPDYMTDEDEGDDELGFVEVVDIPGTVEVEFDIAQPITSQTQSAKRKRFSQSVPVWRKCKPNYTFPEDNFKIIDDKKMEHLKEELGPLTPVQLFEKFLSLDCLEHIRIETLRYAHCVKNDVIFTLEIDELKCFIGILLLSGYHQLPSERMYWSMDDDLNVNIIRNAMPRNKFIKIKSMIHFANNDEMNKQDRAFKLRPIIEKINNRFQQFGIFTSFLSIDEMIVKYYGHHGLKQFIKGKPIRFGYKLWALCGSSGYCYKFIFYTGKETKETTGLNLGSRVVTELLTCVPTAKEHAIFFDNFFTNRDLLVHLASLKKNY